MADTLLFRGGSSASIDVANVQSREIVIDTDTDQIVSGPSRRKTVMEDGNGDISIDGSASFASDVKIGGTLPSAPAISLKANGSATFASGYASINSSGSATFSGPVSIGGTAAANTIDEYEEGTFTPGFSVGGTAITLSTPTAGTYTRVGNVCHFSVILKALPADYAGATGLLTITGLPFASPDSSASNYTIGSVGLRGFVSDYNNGTKTMYAYNSSNSNSLFLANGEQDTGRLTEAVLSGTCRLYVTISYTIA